MQRRQQLAVADVSPAEPHVEIALVVLLDQTGKFDGAGQTGGPAAHEQHVHRDVFLGRRLPQNQLVRRKPGLVIGWRDGSGHVRYPESL